VPLNSSDASFVDQRIASKIERFFDNLWENLFYKSKIVQNIIYYEIIFKKLLIFVRIENFVSDVIHKKSINILVFSQGKVSIVKQKQIKQHNRQPFLENLWLERLHLPIFDSNSFYRSSNNTVFCFLCSK
jgi:hypothetical protein